MAGFQNDVAMVNRVSLKEDDLQRLVIVAVTSSSPLEALQLIGRLRRTSKQFGTLQYAEEVSTYFILFQLKLDSLLPFLEDQGESKIIIDGIEDQIDSIMTEDATAGAWERLYNLFKDLKGAVNLGGNALHKGVKDGDVEVVQALIEIGADVNATGDFGMTALHLASYYGKTEVFRALIDAGADVTKANIFGDTPLQHDGLKRHIVKIDELSETILPWFTDANRLMAESILASLTTSLDTVETDTLSNWSGVLDTLGNWKSCINLVNVRIRRSAFHAAAYGGGLRDSDAFEAVSELIKAGADLNAVDDQGRAAHMLACSMGHVEMTLHLIEAGADVYATDNDGFTILHWAVMKSDSKLVLELIKSKVDIHAKCNDGKTALHLASRSHNTTLAPDLIAAGANLNVQDNYGSTALHLATASGHTSVVLDLIKFGADLKIKDAKRNTVLHEAVTGVYNIVLLKHLLEAGADVNAQNIEGKTALHDASDVGFARFVEMLLSAGADFHAKDCDGNTALHTASSNCMFYDHALIVSMLIDAGANVHDTNKQGETALSLASGLTFKSKFRNTGPTSLHEAFRDSVVKVLKKTRTES